jgi:hypothetical protein
MIETRKLTTWNSCLENVKVAEPVKKIPCDLWKPRIHYRSFIPSQINRGHILQLFLLKIKFNIVFPSMPTSSKWSLLFMFFELSYAPPISHSLIKSKLWLENLKQRDKLKAFGVDGRIIGIHRQNFLISHF